MIRGSCLENGDRCEVGPPEALICRIHGFSIGTSDLTLHDLQGSKITVMKL